MAKIGPFWPPSKSVQWPRGINVNLAPGLGLAKFYEPTKMGFPRVYPKIYWVVSL